MRVASLLFLERFQFNKLHKTPTVRILGGANNERKMEGNVCQER